MIDSDYIQYRGKCLEMSQAAVAADPTLTLVRGYYMCPLWNTVEPHWWTKRPDGTIYDPTAKQFPSKGAGFYEEFIGIISCEHCGKGVAEQDAYFYEHHAYCSETCFGHDVGF